MYFYPNKATAVWSPTATSLLLRPHTLQVVVEGQLRACGNVLNGKESNASVSAHRPLLCLAVRLAGVIHEPKDKKLHSGVNNDALTLNS